MTRASETRMRTCKREKRSERRASTNRAQMLVARLLAELVWLQLHGQVSRADARQMRAFARWFATAVRRWEP